MLRILRITSALLALALCLFPVLSALGEEDGYSESGGFFYQLNSSGTATVMGHEGKPVKLEVPPILDGHPVTAVGDDAFNEYYDLEEITLPEGIVSIGAAAFSHCDNLARITIPEGVVAIGEFAFGGCYSLKEITLPGSLVTIGDGAFGDCSGLERMEIPEGVITIGNYPFIACTSLARVVLPASVASIGEDAFESCESLTGITVVPGSFAEKYCLEHGLPCSYSRP